MHNTVYTAVYIPLAVDDDKNGLCICCCTYHITTSIFSHISYTRTHHCSLSTHHYTLMYTSCTLKPIYITTLLYIQAYLHLHHYTLHILFIHTTVNMYIPHHWIGRNSSTMIQTAVNMDCVCLKLRLKIRLQKWSCKGLCKNRSAKSHPNAQTICYYLLTWSLLLAAMGFFTKSFEPSENEDN